MSKQKYKKSDFTYDLPDELIARYPLAQRSASRLLHVHPISAHSADLHDHQVTDFISLLNDNDLLVFNNTRVLPARLHGCKASGGKVEILIERVKSAHEVRAYIRASKSPKSDSQLNIDGYQVTVTGRDDALFTLYSTTPWHDLLSKTGEMPIPPYLDRDAEKLDDERYQTVYNAVPGAVAAPTAGLHFDQAMLDAIDARGIATTQVTLHVGAGTFQPVRHENLDEHIMHEEWLQVSEETVKAVNDCKKKGGRVIAIGTTSLRALESAAQSGLLQPFVGDTNLFITPGDQFYCVDALFTNFHLPESTLLMLVSAFAGVDNIRDTYLYAIKQKYRFYSYGDAMFIDRIAPH
ncbi:tRNA preQ1(34) S-adenosylmethionine ribosyltransferase-isomerase QueA [Cardiobacteriaceae bacterium TAE3-ERU3]|nr:tRNA preQ1(34) S-adenosylmethionine ribosyltransferase-isomerase QueA [Cardiobacteriaceae bacterium TAE3-ERU3]